MCDQNHTPLPTGDEPIKPLPVDVPMTPQTGGGDPPPKPPK